jgi:protoporphyrinogen oxidase
MADIIGELAKKIVKAIEENGSWEYKANIAEYDTKLVISIRKEESKEKFVVTIRQDEFEKVIKNDCPIQCVIKLIQTLTLRKQSMYWQRKNITNFEGILGLSLPAP